MKNLLFTVCLIGMAFVFSGCPIGLDYSAGKEGKEKIDKKLIGTWTNSLEDPEVKSVKIEKGTAKNTYKVTVLEKGSMYALNTDNLTGYCTKIANKTFVYFKPSDENKYYLYHYEWKKSSLITHDVTLLRGGVDKVTSTETLRSQIQASLKSDSCLTNTQTWSKK